MIKSVFKYPEMRTELLSSIFDLADFNHQKNFWNVEAQKKALEETGKMHSFDLSVHFLFDDTPLAEDAESCIGYYIKDMCEADAITQVTIALEELFKIHGTDLSDEEYIYKPEWQWVLKAAQNAKKVLLKIT